ncbi:uncharacterized protein LOC127864493 [Dreissena polymorpha]|uniref:DUF4326 domain-containing protein n=1 Tax=Dreissena polymorpha TaxID=45954 RepID=A0A9D4SAT8_DREPO|nr:uncharacterized protein LOC127864493 [Dreissena polymorpha]KAH3896910.1 hypothetical protein DPMN_021094 [Dreissena polymorpha]
MESNQHNQQPNYTERKGPWSAGNQIGPASRRKRDRHGAQHTRAIKGTSTPANTDTDMSKHIALETEAELRDSSPMSDLDAKTWTLGSIPSSNKFSPFKVPTKSGNVTPGSALKQDFVYKASGQATQSSNTTVVNVHKSDLNKLGYRDLEHWLSVPGHVYIGRDMSRYVSGAIGSIWGNPFRSRKLGNAEPCQMYRQYVINDTRIQSNGKTLLESLSELKGKTLGCWCHPEQCHGHMLVELIAEYCP